MARDPEAGELERLKGSVGLATWREAAEANRFLAWSSADASRA